MKRLLTALLLLCLACCAACAEDPEKHQAGDYTYVVLEDGTAEIVRYSGGAKTLDVPAELDGVRVTRIGKQAFLYSRSLISVTIPDSVTRIGDSAFASCDCLISFTIPDSVTSIGNYAFESCSGLTSVTIPASVTDIGANPFENCKKLLEIRVYLGHPLLAVTDGVLFRKTDKTLICYPMGRKGVAYTIPAGTSSIGDNAFYRCETLSNVTIPDSVTSIGNSAFYSCSGLTNIIIPDSVTSIGDSVFHGCSGLTSVMIPDGVMEIGTNPFRSCEELSEIRVSAQHPVFAATDGVLFRKTDKTLICYPEGKKGETYVIPTGTSAIGDYAFASCETLTSITIPDGVTSIGDSVFSGCSKLISVTFPDSVTSIGDFLFFCCYNLASITIPDRVTSIGEGVFYRCTGLTSISIPESITSIGDSTFRGCSALARIRIPDSVISIGDKTFYNCPNLTLTVRKNSYAEQYCKDSELNYQYPDVDYCTFAASADGTMELTGYIGKSEALITLTLPAEANGLPVTQISDGALRSCTYLTSVSLPETVTISGANPFRFCENLAHLYVSPENPSLAVIDDVLFRKTDRTLICCPRGRGGASYAIPEGIARIGAYAFDDCALTAVTIPDSVTFIGEGAFRGCSGLTALTIPEGVTEIGAQAFADCPNLTLTVTRDSAAAQYCRDNGLKYEYTDALDWLHS